MAGAISTTCCRMPYTEEALDVVVRNVGRLQDALGRQVSIENPSCYLGFTDFDLVRTCVPGRAGAPQRLWPAARRQQYRRDGAQSPARSGRLAGGPVGEAITQYHLAGHAVNDADGEPILIDDHGSRVGDGVWGLFARIVKCFGARPTLVEWDTDIPPLDVLLDEAARAAGVIETALQAGGPNAARAA